MKSKDKAPITEVIEVFLDAHCQSYSKASFYEYVKAQLARKTTKKNDKDLAFPVRNIGSGTEKGLFMNDPKEGAKSVTEKNYWYSDKEIGERLSRSKSKRKTAN
jgi:hypothetical protein